MTVLLDQIGDPVGVAGALLGADRGRPIGRRARVDTIIGLSDRAQTETNGGVPERPSLDGLEQKWSEAWERDGTYRFDRSAPRERVFSIDTPPPTVSGSLHVG